MEKGGPRNVGDYVGTNDIDEKTLPQEQPIESRKKVEKVANNYISQSKRSSNKSKKDKYKNEDTNSMVSSSLNTLKLLTNLIHL